MRRILVLTAVLLAATLASAAERVNKSRLGGVAAKGYDVVAYFEDGEPREGSSELTHEWRGATWRFASAGHRDRFAEDPARYAPQYGGYCAFAVAHDTTADVDPHAWRIVDGKLYLNKNADIEKRWEKDVPGNIERTDANWPALSQQ